MPFEELLSLPVEWQVAILTAGLTQYIKGMLPMSARKWTPFMAMLLGVGMMLLLKQSLLVTDAVSGLLIGFSVTSLYAIAKEFVKSVGTE